MRIGRTLFCIATFAGLYSIAAQQARTVDVQLLAINDLHANLEPLSGSSGAVNGTPAGGIEYLATHLRKAFRENPNSLLVGAGDLMGASPLISGLFHDTPTIEALNALNFSVTSVGNHEFDHGPDDLLARIHGGCLQPEGCKDGDVSPAAKYTYLAANVIRTSDGKTLAAARDRGPNRRRRESRVHRGNPGGISQNHFGSGHSRARIPGRKRSGK